MALLSFSHHACLFRSTFAWRSKAGKKHENNQQQIYLQKNATLTLSLSKFQVLRCTRRALCLREPSMTMLTLEERGIRWRYLYDEDYRNNREIQVFPLIEYILLNSICKDPYREILERTDRDWLQSDLPLNSKIWWMYFTCQYSSLNYVSCWDRTGWHQ